MDTEMTCYESFADVTKDFYCSAVDVLKILVLRLLCTTIFLPMPHRILMPMFPLSIPSPRLALPVLPERILLTVQSMQEVRYELYLFVYHF